MDRPRLSLLAMAGWLCTACPPGERDPYPPEENLAIPSAPPRALGALAGGTDAAPPAVFRPRRPPEDAVEIPLPGFDFDAGIEPLDAGTQEGDELPL